MSRITTCPPVTGRVCATGRTVATAPGFAVRDRMPRGLRPGRPTSEACAAGGRTCLVRAIQRTEVRRG
jgi:hypothetical protein